MPPAPPPARTAAIRRTLHTFALLALAALICGQLGRLHWFAELFSHFLPCYAALFLLAAILPRSTRWRGLWVAATLAAAVWRNPSP